MLVFRGWLVLLVGLLSAAVTGVIVALQPAQYQAQAIISVGGTGSTDGAVALATSDRVMQEAAQLSGQTIGPSDWRAHSTVDAPGGGLVSLLVVLPDGVRATKIAASWGQALVGVLQELETSQAGNPAVGPTLVSLPTQATRVSSQWGLKVLTSGVVGLVVGLVGVLVVRAAKIPG
jgi:uncharacterized protein involved in exopolysaccharide biosynthesis